MDPWAEHEIAADIAGPRPPKRKAGPRRIALPKPSRRPHRDELARTVGTLRELAEFVAEIRSGLSIPQAKLAARSGVSRQWLIALESGRPTVEAGKVFRTLEALGFEVTLTPYDPAPPWVLREMAAQELKRAVTAREARRRRNGRRARAKLSRLAQNVTGGGLDLS